jgi:hypothetical protein
MEGAMLQQAAVLRTPAPRGALPARRRGVAHRRCDAAAGRVVVAASVRAGAMSAA